MAKPNKTKSRGKISCAVMRFSGDSGDGMQLVGQLFTDTVALSGNKFSTFSDFPAEIRAPAGTLPGVSSFQIQISDSPVFSPGDDVDVLIAMNPAALKVNLGLVKKGGTIILNENVFHERALEKASWKKDPLKDGTLKKFRVARVPMTDLTRKALTGEKLSHLEVERCKNFFALGLSYWIYGQSLEAALKWIEAKFRTRPDIGRANSRVLAAGYAFAQKSLILSTQYRVGKALFEPGEYRKISGNGSIALGLMAAAQRAKKTLFYASYPITPASSILHELAGRKEFGVKTFQAEDEIAAVCAAIGASYGGQIGVTGTSGPGLCLKSEGINLAVMAELPIVVIDVQRAGPSTGMPTKTEQSDLLQSFFGRNGESPVVLLAVKTPSEGFQMAVEAVRLACRAMAPVILLSDGYLANAEEPWKLPDLKSLPVMTIQHPVAGSKNFLPYERDPETLARAWAIPGTPGLEHRIGGLEKQDGTGGVSYDPFNHEKMVEFRAEKIERLAELIPPAEVEGDFQAEIAVLGWGSTYGAIHHALGILKEMKVKIAHIHLAYLHPLPKNLEGLLKRYKKILIPEMNRGQLKAVLRMKFPGLPLIGYSKIQGQPFRADEIVERLMECV
ncbi:MAG: 2-oxoacid:acceptor oxidoreductase subunit alpha [Candidatus Omnitrophica bacterium]|nr:2-oxoacid:acceptor oxidoreductase subunit alpha [Candidatus Omnitrophota bacterium]